MIALAVVTRSAIDGGKSNGGAPASSGPVTLVCLRELESVCTALSRPNVTVRVEDASITARALAKGDTSITAWVTLDPWPAMVNQLAHREVTTASTPVAATDLVIAMVQERADRLAPKGGGTVGWHCLGDAIGHPWTDVGGQPEWGTVKAGIPPVSSAAGLLLLGNAASGYFGSTTFATNDFDDAFLVWKGNVVRQPSSFTTFIQQFPAAFSAVGSTRAEVTAQAGSRPVVTIVARSAVCTFTTSAPRSPSMRVQNGPASTWLRSTTRRPSRGREIVAPDVGSAGGRDQARTTSSRPVADSGGGSGAPTGVDANRATGPGIRTAGPDQRTGRKNSRNSCCGFATTCATVCT